MPENPERPARLSAVDAATAAVELVKRRLFPFRLEVWLVLGFAAFLDRCGRAGAGSGFQFPFGGGGSGGTGVDSESGGGVDDWGAGEVTAWLSEHAVLIAAVVLGALVLIVGLMAVFLWINSRGVFIYLDDVATGRHEIVRPWHEHRAAAWSYFGWSFGLSLATLGFVLLLLAPMAWVVLSLLGGGPAWTHFATIGCLFLLMVAAGIAASLALLLLRDFGAPLQLSLGVPAGQALRTAWGLVTADPIPFLAYVGLKIVFSIAFGILTFVAGCVTCCIGFLPVIAQTVLQPLYYFERAWSLELLRQAGYDLFPAASAVEASVAPASPPPPPPAAGG